MKKDYSVFYNTQSNINLSTQKESNEHILSKKHSKIVNFINKRFSQGILTNLSDLQQFSKSKKDNTVATRKLASRLCNTGAIESINGIYIPTGQAAYFKNVNIKYLSKIKTKRDKNTIFKAKKQVIQQLRQIIQDNKWCFPSTYLTIQLNIKNIYQKLGELNILQPDNNCCYVIPLKDKNLPYLKISFYIHPNDNLTIKVGNKRSPIHANESIISSALWICYKYLKQTIQFWNLNLEVPSISDDWGLSIPYIYSISLNNNYTKLPNKIQDTDLGIELTDKGNHLLLKSKSPRIKLKPKHLHDFLNKFNPLNFVNKTFFENYEADVTHCKNIGKPSILNNQNNIWREKNN